MWPKEPHGFSVSPFTEQGAHSCVSLCCLGELSFLWTSIPLMVSITVVECTTNSHWIVIVCCSVTKSCLTLWDSVDYSMPGLPVPHHLLEFTQVHVHCTSDAIQPSHPLTLSSPSALSLSQLFFNELTFCVLPSSKWLGQRRHLLILRWIPGLGQVFYWVELLCGKVRVQRELSRYFL